MKAGKNRRRKRASRFTLREMRGMGILALGGQLRKIDDRAYFVRSQSGPGFHRVLKEGASWTCDCADYEKTSSLCKHMAAVRFAKQLPSIVRGNADVIEGGDCP